MELSKIQTIFNKVSLGEATSEDRDFLESLTEETFFSYLEEFKGAQSVEINCALDMLIEETREEVKELDTSYSSEIIPEASNNSAVRNYARNKGLAKRFIKKQRISV